MFATVHGWITSESAPERRCSLTGAPPPVNYPSNTFHANEYWAGTQLAIPGAAGGELLTVTSGPTPPATGGPFYWLTADRTYVSCLPAVQNGSGEGFLAITADGTKYWFDWMATFPEPKLTKKRQSPYVGNDDLQRRRYALYATRVEDRFGNWVRYTYANAASSPVRLAAIDASDGRRIALSYNASGYVESASAGSQTWRYEYSGDSLTGVVLPDGSRWAIAFSGFESALVRYYTGQPGDPLRTCMDPGDVVQTAYTGSITHPSGAVGEFTVVPTRFGRSNVLAMCSNVTVADPATGSDPNDPNDDVAYYPIAWDSLALSKKRVSGPGLVPAEWAYSYYSTVSWFYSGGGNADMPVCTQGDCIAPQCVSDSCAGSALTEVTGPADDYTRYTFGNSYRYNEGKLLKVERGASPAAIAKVETNVYELAQTGLAFPAAMGLSPQRRSGAGFVAEYPRPSKGMTVTQDGVSFQSQVNSFDAFARPLSVTRQSALGYGKTDATEYYDDTSKWVLGQVTRQYNADTGVVMAQTDYDTATALPVRTYGFGKLQQSLAYWPDGTLKAVTDGRNETTTLSNWKRGIPQRIQYPDGTGASAVVDDAGWITATADENEYWTNFTYDAMGRLASIVYPTGDSTAWNNVAMTFQQINTPDRGLPAGHWRRDRYQGTRHTHTYYDALWRPVMELDFDAADPTWNTQTQVLTRYDARGRLVYQSYPTRHRGSYLDTAPGVRTSYDVLDRVTRVEQDSESGVLATTTEYLAGFQRRSTNPRGFATTQRFQAYDIPSYDWPVGIDAPQGVTTTISRDRFGKPVQLIRTGPDG